MKNNILFDAVSSASSYLNRKQKKKMGLFAVALLGTSLLDVIGLATIVPVIQIATKPEIIETNYYISTIYNFFGFQDTDIFLLCLILGVFGAFLFKNSVIVAVNYRIIKFIAYLTTKVIGNQYSKYYQLKYWHFNNLGASKIINYVNSTPNTYCNYILLSLFKIAAEVFVVAFIIIGIAVYKPALFLILVVILGPATFLIYRALKDRTKKVGDEMDHLRPKVYSLLYDSFEGYVDVKLANKQKLFKDKFLTLKKDYLDLNVWSKLYKLLPPKAVETIAILGVVLIFVYSLFLSNQTASVLTLLGWFVAAAYRLMPSVNRILSSFMSLKNHHYAMNNMELYREQKYQEKSSGVRQSLAFKKSIKIKNLTYSFPDASSPTLRDISFNVSKGEQVGIVGPSGSGKTTLMNILLGFYKGDAGSILIDGKTLDEHNLLSWRNLAGYVRQDVFIMEGSIKDNITLGDEEIDKPQLNKAIEQASLSNFIATLPNGVDTYIGEKGSKLSGGQKQRVGIARALYHKAEILFFDEATSALDNETEKEVTEAINKLSDTNVTLFVIAHRVTTLKNCDRIFELEDGKLIAEHQYEELIRAVV